VRLNVKQTDLNWKCADELWRVFAHEVSHFLLGDEYVGAAKVLAPEDAFVDDRPNVQPLASVLAPITEPDFSKRKISGDLIKWRRPRIRRAAVIAGVLNTVAGGFSVPVVAGQGSQFNPPTSSGFVRERRRCL
jgi:hypothetical protein